MLPFQRVRLGSLQGSIRQAKAFVPSLLRSAGYIIHGHSFANPTSATTSRERERERVGTTNVKFWKVTQTGLQCIDMESYSNFWKVTHWLIYVLILPLEPQVRPATQ